MEGTPAATPAHLGFVRGSHEARKVLQALDPRHMLARQQTYVNQEGAERVAGASNKLSRLQSRYYTKACCGPMPRADWGKARPPLPISKVQGPAR